MTEKNYCTVIKFKDSAGNQAKKGQKLTVQYACALALADLEKGKYIDQSFDRYPIEFVLGNGEVLAGLDSSLEGMPVGGTYRILIPPEQAFAELGVLGLVPPYTSLAFEVYLVKAEEVGKST